MKTIKKRIEIKREVKSISMAKLTAEVSVKDTEVFISLLEFTNKIITELEGESCYSSTAEEYRKEFNQIINVEGEYNG